MWQNDENKMEMNQGWNIPNRGDDKNSDQKQQMDAEKDKLGLENFDELLGAIGGCDNFMSTGSKMTANNNNNNNNNSTSDNGLSFNNTGQNCDDGDNHSFPNYNFTSGTTFNNHSERSHDGLNKNEGWPSIGSHRGENSLNCGGSSNSMNNDSGWGCASQQLQQNQFQQSQSKQSTNTQSNNQGAPASGWGNSSNISKGSKNRNWLNESNTQDGNDLGHMVRDNDYSYGSHQNGAMAPADGENKPAGEIIDPALLSDNWGKTVINQEKLWDLPPSSQSSPNVNSVMWSFGASVTGTEIWEYTVRNQTKALISAASSAPSANAPGTAAVSSNQKVSQPWGHNPASNIGGNWGEEEDSSNVWTGVPSGTSSAPPLANVVGVTAPVINANKNNPVPSESDSGSDNVTSIWGNSNKANNGQIAPNIAVNAPNSGVIGNFGGHIANNSNMNIVNPSVVGIKRDNSITPLNINSTKGSCSSSTSSTGSGSGSVNIGTWGTAQGGFGKTGAIQPTGWDADEENAKKRAAAPPAAPPVAATAAAAAANASSGNVDDGTAVWGKPEQHNKIARWKDPANAKLPGNSANGNNNALASQNKNGAGSGITSPSPGMIRLPPGAPGLKGNNSNNMGNNKGNSGNNNNNQNKQGNLIHDGGDIGDNASTLGTDLWNKQPMNRGWTENQNSNSKNNSMPIGGFGGWSQKSESGTSKTTPGTPNTPGGNGGGGWGSDVGPASPLPYWGSKGRSGGTNNWLAGDEPIDADGNWNKSKPGMPSQNPPQISKEMLNSSKVYRLLMEMGCKKEDIENALRSSGLSKEDLNDLARAFPMRDNMGEMDLRGKGQASSNTPASLLLNPGLVNSSLSSIINRNPSQGMQQAQPQVTLPSQTQDHIMNVQQSTSQQQHDQSQIHHQLNQAPSQALPSINHVQNMLRNQAAKNLGSGQPNLPSEKQLMHLVQQIQLAVQSGHLNAQILNQPLAYQTIQLINQLLQNIKTLQQLQMQIASHPKNGGPFNNNSSQSNLHVQITQTKLRIQNLQNQITIQQGLFLKQQQQQVQMTVGPTHSQGSLVNPTASIYSQANGDIDGGGAQNQSQQMLANAQSSHAQGVLHSSIVPNIGNSNSVPPVFNPSHGNGNGAGMDFLKDSDNIQLNNDFRDLSLKDFTQSGGVNVGGAHQGLGVSGINGAMNAFNVATSQGHHQGNGGQHQQYSRLKQWKTNSNFDREEHGSSSSNNDFLRAPGSSKNHPNEASGLNRGNGGDNGSSIGGWSGLSFPVSGADNSNWSKDSMMNTVSIASNSVPSSVMGPNGTQAGDLKSLVMSSSSGLTGSVMTAPSQTTVSSLDLNDINNLVPEFEPGKPWKGVTGMKIEDDPHITPGSVTRSPLSVNTIRDPAILTSLYNNWSAKGASPTSMNCDILAPSVGLSSSNTWAFNSNANAGWGAIPNENHNPEALWSGGSMTKTRGPPPGLGQERLGPRGDQSMAGIRPQSSSFNNWMMNPSTEGDHLSNGGLESKDLLFSRMMNNSNGMGLGMGVNIGNKWM